MGGFCGGGGCLAIGLGLDLDLGMGFWCRWWGCGVAFCLLCECGCLEEEKEDGSVEGCFRFLDIAWLVVFS